MIYWHETQYVMETSTGFLLVPEPGPCCFVHLAKYQHIIIKYLLHAKYINYCI